MTRRLLATATLATVLTGGFIALATPANALCIGSESQRQPGMFQGFCVSYLTDGTRP